MTTDITKTDNTVVITVSGRLDTTTSADFEKRLTPLFTSQEVILDCREMEYISSAGLRVILAAQKKLQKERLLL